MPFIAISHPLFRAKILTQGAQLIEWAPTEAEDVLFSCDLSTFREGQPFRGGIPICWPWFGKSHSPVHGFARILPWELISQIETPQSAVLRFRLTDSPRTREIWNHPFTLLLTMELSSTCTLTLDIDAPIETTGALHTYVHVDEITTVAVTGLGSRYSDSLDHLLTHNDSPTTLTLQSETDRIYTTPDPVTIVHEPHRSVSLTHNNHSDVVLWNPWTTASPSDMKPEDYRRMICIETARISQSFRPKDHLSLTLTSGH